MSKSKNSLVANINKRKKAGTSRPKSAHSIDKESYAAMEAGWPKKKKKRKTEKKASSKKTSLKKTPSKKTTKKKTTKKKSTKKKSAKKA